MKSDINKIFSKSSCLTNNEMLEYLSGKLSDSEKRKIEMHIADCEMCNDELEGLSNMKDSDQLSSIIHSVNSDIDKYLKQFEKNGAVKTSKTYNIKRIFAVAASFLLLISAGFIVNYYMNNNTESLADMQKKESTELSEESPVMTEKEAEKDESVKLDVASSTVDDNYNTAVIEQSRENNIDKIHSDKNKNTEDLADDDASDRILQEEEAEEDIVVITSDISENRNKDSERDDNKLAGQDDETAAGEISDSFIGYSTRHIPKENFKGKKEEAVKYKSIKTGALLSYDGKVYNEAADGFGEYLKYKPNDSEVIFKYGLSSYYIKDYSNALKSFDKIISSGKNKYLEDAEWYKSQALMKIGKNKEAADLLRKIVLRNGKHKIKASGVLKQLN